MTRKFLRFLMPAALTLPFTAVAQSSSPAPLPAAPSAAASGAMAPVVTTATGSKLGTINLQEAIAATNEGQRDLEALSKKFEPKQAELKGMNDEVESLKKQVNTQSDKLNEESRGTLMKQLEQRQKSFERARQDAMDDFQNQQGEIAQRILQKLGPIVIKYAGDNGFGVILDTTKLWPEGPVVWYGPAVDITKVVVDTYNAQSGVPAPTKPAATGNRPLAPGPKPVTAPAAPKPQASPPHK